MYRTIDRSEEDEVSTMREGLGDCGGSSDGLEWSAVWRLA